VSQRSEGGTPPHSRRSDLRGIVADLLKARDIDRQVADDETLAEAGLTSTDMVALLLAVEATFDIEVRQDDITPEVFRSIATIDAMLAKYRIVPRELNA
jgi:acyl carrier protein